MLQVLQVTEEDVERCEESSELSSWFGAVSANDVSSVESMIQQRTDVNAAEVHDSLYFSCLRSYVQFKIYTDVKFNVV